MGHNQDQYEIDAIINGDTRVFAILVDRYKHMVFTLAMKILKNREEAEEVSQDVFLKVYQQLKTFKGDSKCSTWIYRIAYNRSLDYLKKQGRSLNAMTLDSAMEYQFDTHDNVLLELDVMDRKTAIRAAIGKLPENDAVIITLHYFEELSLKEISEVMSLEANTIKVRLFRSRKRLAELLKNKLEPDMLNNYGRE
ncbi:MAG: RNA polymerase sigma factor [Flavobacteriaceae bacterium]